VRRELERRWIEQKEERKKEKSEGEWAALIYLEATNAYILDFDRHIRF